jgi:hypothetical protein
MLEKVFVLTACVLVSRVVLALPEFTGMRDDDKPVDSYDVRGKNENVGIPDVQDIRLASEEMIIRVYADHRGNRNGGHPYDLKELRVKGDMVSMLWYPTCMGDPELPRTSPDSAWRVLQEQEFFTIRDYRNFPLRTVVVDGQVLRQPPSTDGDYYVVQIKTADAYREFIFPLLQALLRNPRMPADFWQH